VFVLVSGNDGDVRASVEDPGNLKQLHAEFLGERIPPLALEGLTLRE